jgi:hypothetical protein
MHSFGLLQHLIWNAFVVIFVCLTLLKRYFNFNVNPMNFFFISNSFSSANAYGAAGRHSRTAAPHGLARQTYPTGGDPWPSLLDAAWGQTRRGARTFTPALVARLACYVIAPGTEGATFRPAPSSPLFFIHTSSTFGIHASCPLRHTQIRPFWLGFAVEVTPIKLGMIPHTISSSSVDFLVYWFGGDLGLELILKCSFHSKL